jgi:hypothetical protein
VAVTIPASHRALVEAPGVGVLSTVGADGYPQSKLMARVLRHYGRDPETFPEDWSVERVRLTLHPVHVLTWG